MIRDAAVRPFATKEQPQETEWYEARENIQSPDSVRNTETILMPVNIWDFTDYRLFLKESFAAAKAMGNPVSNRWLARRLGFRSFSFITMLLQGKRNLTRPNREKFARLLGLSGEESDYFAALVDYNQARGPEDRERALRALAVIQRPGERRTIAGATVFASPDAYLSICRLIEEFKSRVEQVARVEGGEVREYRLNLQFFPLTPTPESLHFSPQKLADDASKQASAG